MDSMGNTITYVGLYRTHSDRFLCNQNIKITLKMKKSQKMKTSSKVKGNPKMITKGKAHPFCIAEIRQPHHALSIIHQA